MSYSAWNISACRPEAPEPLVRAGYTPLLAAILCRRGLDTPEAAQAFLEGGPELRLPLAVNIVVIIPQVALPGGVHPGGGAPKELGHGVVGGTTEVEAHTLIDLLEPREGVLGVGELGPLLHQPVHPSIIVCSPADRVT